MVKRKNGVFAKLLAFWLGVTGTASSLVVGFAMVSGLLTIPNALPFVLSLLIFLGWTMVIVSAIGLGFQIWALAQGILKNLLK